MLCSVEHTQYRDQQHRLAVSLTDHEHSESQINTHDDDDDA